MKLLIDQMVRSAGGSMSAEALRPLLFLGGAMAAIGILHEGLQALLEWVRARQAQLIHDYVSALIQTRSLEVDLAFYETPEYYDRLYRARDDGQNRFLHLLEQLGSVLQNACTLFVLMLIVAAYQNTALIAAMAVSVIPGFYVVARTQLLTHAWWTRTTTERRWIQYYDQKFSTAAAAAEMRLFALGPHFQAAYQKLRSVLRESYLKMVHRQNLARISAHGWRVSVGRVSRVRRLADDFRKGGFGGPVALLPGLCRGAGIYAVDYCRLGPCLQHEPVFA